MSGRLVVCLFGCLVGWLAGGLAAKSTKLGVENRSTWLQKPPSWMSKSFKIGPKRPLGGVLGVPRGVLEGSWGSQEGSWRGLGSILSPRGPQERKMLQNSKVGFPSWEPSWGSKSTKNRSWGDPKGDHFLDRFLG